MDENGVWTSWTSSSGSERGRWFGEKELCVKYNGVSDKPCVRERKKKPGVCVR